MTNPKFGNERPPSWSKSDTWQFLITLAILAVSFALFNHRLPSEVASHYNVNGEVDNTMPKWGFWLLYGAIAVLLPVFMTVMRHFDPRRSNYSRFKSYFTLIRWGFSLFAHVIFNMIILSELGYSIKVPNVIIGAIGVLWFVLGNRMGQVKSNFFVGIKTPWALSDETNWNRTHRLAARLWVIAGILMFAAAWLASSFWLAAVVLVCVAGSTLIPTAYSYLLYARGHKTT
ncbi:SdpI family protein [Cohnella thailandensis]|uniref:SdpI family protein n=1 Tax=Cohnella thailandensis TaxID=557557 RepID=A0A841SQW5_9BACL|nr:SdpI family protein [Cohnella thailandensis]MBB6632538.1 SdpI family protein [Cohnella thailandensis]MBP1971832.1 putative membrane protein [Cohnella thailandensis]